MQKAGLKASDAQVLNMRPPEIAAAWGRGDIDATFIWDPVLSTVEKTGKVLMTSGDICKAGACTFDGLIVTRKFAKENPEFMVALVKALAKADADYRANPKTWTGDAAKVAAVAKWSGAKPAARDAPPSICGNRNLALARHSKSWCSLRDQDRHGGGAFQHQPCNDRRRFRGRDRRLGLRQDDALILHRRVSAADPWNDRARRQA